MILTKKQYDYDFHNVPALASCETLITPPQFCNLLIISYLLKVAFATALNTLSGNLKGVNSGCFKGFKAINAIKVAAIPVKIKSLTKYNNYIIN